MAPISEVTTEYLDQDEARESDRSATDVLPPSRNAEAAAVTEKCCPKCKSTEDWGMTSWCPTCGYYPSLGNEAESVANMEGMHARWDEEETTIPKLPLWSFVLAAGFLAVIAESLFARLMVSNQMGERMIWSLSQLAIGVFVLLCSQVIAGVLAAFRSSDFTPFDILLKPVEVWKANTYRLPKGAWLFCLLGWSITSIFGSIVIIGSIPYNAVFEDWGVKERAKPNLLQAVVSQARQKKKDEGPENLEDAMNQFVGDANAEDLEAEAEATANAKRQEIDCIIVGYVKLSDSYIEKILLSALVGGELKYVGSLNYYELPEETQRELGERMIHYRTKRPLVKVVDKDATWLKPNLMCRISYLKMSENGRMSEIKFEASLADLKP
ncbi:hypothetical protein Pla110_45940 [Polystyrenella longa]|uniref:DNA ligase (ATP) n=2 Tax=Polystyrenella longa TaxID=2528007 RepID=A0A518CUC3_9PLAN|nr:hypothetical protein Pla110_45940 [Polystyrenella longa]